MLERNRGLLILILLSKRAIAAPSAPEVPSLPPIFPWPPNLKIFHICVSDRERNSPTWIYGCTVAWLSGISGIGLADFLYFLSNLVMIFLFILLWHT